MRKAKIIQNVFALCLSVTVLGLISCAPTRPTTQDIYDLQKTANAGRVRSQVMIGEIYEFGVDVPVNHLIAAQWYQLAAKQGDPEAQFYLGVIYERGIGLRRNSAEAMKWLFKSAQQGHEKAQILLAVLYLKNQEIRPEFSNRIKRYRRKAEKGDADAQYNLGWIYMEGVGLQVDVIEGLKWYRKSAEQRNPKARFALGDIYLIGRGGIKANPREALSWYRKSAEADIRAQVRLYRLYQGESGISQNAETAGYYLKSISKNTDASLSAYLDMQHTLLNSERTKNPALALRACGRISAYDPDSGKVATLCDTLQKEMSGKMKSRTREAQAALEQKDWKRFGNLLDRLLTPDFDASQFRGFLAPGRRLMAQEAHATEKIAQDQLHALEAALRNWSPRTSNTHQINKLINAFQETIDRGAYDHPEHEAFFELARKGKKIIAGLRKKMKAPPPPEEKVVDESPEDLQEDIEPDELDYTKARELFNGGHFEEAEALFEKTTKTRGSRYIAAAYIYLGIGHLARINPANVSDARKRHLNGLSCFQNALRFDEGIALPTGYDKYQPVFDQAKEQLHSQR